MSADSGERRLAIIVALDAVGYSRQSEVDEQVAIKEVSALHERVAASAAAHHGRVFNTAGDGFMLEFASASGVLAFADEMFANARLPLRAGVHVGEVSTAPNGDLLGHGVNVAARLQVLAQPGELIASGETKRALPTALQGRLRSRGTVKLDKMHTRIEINSLSSPWQKPARVLMWRRAAMGLLAPHRFAAALAAFAASPRRWASTG